MKCCLGNLNGQKSGTLLSNAKWCHARELDHIYIPVAQHDSCSYRQGSYWFIKTPPCKGGLRIAPFDSVRLFILLSATCTNSWFLGKINDIKCCHLVCYWETGVQEWGIMRSA